MSIRRYGYILSLLTYIRLIGIALVVEVPRMLPRSPLPARMSNLLKFINIIMSPTITALAAVAQEIFSKDFHPRLYRDGLNPNDLYLNCIV